MDNIISCDFNITRSGLVLAKYPKSNFLSTSLHPFTYLPSFYQFFFEHKSRVLLHCIWPGAASSKTLSNICKVLLVHKVFTTFHINHLKSSIDENTTFSIFKDYYV